MPALKQINIENAPEAIGPYSQGLRAGDMLFLSGQIPLLAGNIYNLLKAAPL